MDVGLSPQSPNESRVVLRAWEIGAVGFGVLIGLGVVGLAGRSARVLGWFIGALFAATLLAAIIEFLERWMGHRGAVVFTAVCVIAGGALLSLRIVDELQRELAHLKDSAPGAIERLESSSRFGSAIRSFELGVKTDRWLTDLPNRLGGGSAADAARLAGSRASAFLAGIVLTCFICAGGRVSFQAMLRWFPERQGQLLNRHSLGQMLERSHRRLRTMMLISVSRSCVCGLAVGLMFGLAGIPAPTLFGLLFAVSSLVPGIGLGTAGLVSLVAVIGFTDGSTTARCVAGIAAVIAGSYLLTIRARRSGMIYMGPAVGLAGFIIGAELGGIGTALCVLFAFGFIVSVWSEFVRVRLLREQAQGPEVIDTPSSDTPTLDTSNLDTPNLDTPNLGTTGFDVAVATGIGVQTARSRRPTARRDLQPYARLVFATTGFWVLFRTALTLGGNARETLLLILVSLLIALAVNQVIAPLSSRLGNRRSLAITAVGFALLFTLVVSLLLVAPIVSNKAKSFGAEIPQISERLAKLPFIGKRLSDADVPAKIQEWLANVPANISDNSSEVTQTLWGASDMVLNVILTLLMAYGFVVDGPRIVGSARRAFRPTTRRTIDQSARLISKVVGRYFAGSLFVASLAGVMALIVGLSLGVILAPIAALWIGATNVIPQVGGFLGGSVLVVLGFTTSTTTGLLCLGYFLVYQQIENHLIQPAIIGKAVSLSPAATMMIALIGGSAMGVPGALIAIPVVGAIKTVARQVMGGSAPVEH